jgi:SEC-C motif-containing protein
MTPACPCGAAAPYADCCGRYIDGNGAAPTAEALMRSRYTAYTLKREHYLLATWHASTRPRHLGLDADARTQWLGLDVRRHAIDPDDDNRAIVEFIARFKVGGERAQRLHEISRFVRENERWYYLDGDTDANGKLARAQLRRSS